MKIYNRYFICLLAVLLAGCKKKKRVTSSATTALEIENSGGSSEEVEFVEKSAMEAEDVAEAANSSKLSTFADLTTRFYYAFDTDTIYASDFKHLDKLAQWLSDNKSMKIIIYGNCDQRGSATYNMGLGSRRATSVQKALIARGVDPSRIKVVSLGQTILVEGDSHEAYAKNRVSIVEIEGQDFIKKIKSKAKTVSSKVVQAVNPSTEDEEDDEEDDN